MNNLYINTFQESYEELYPELPGKRAWASNFSGIIDGSASVASHIAYLFGVGKIIGSNLGPNRIIAKDVKS